MQSAWLTGLAALVVGLVVVVADVAPIRDMAAYNAGAFGNTPQQTFHSTNIVAPIFGVNTWNARQLATHSLPYLFVTGWNRDFPGLFIFNATDLSLVWAEAATPKVHDTPDTANLQPQMYDGKHYLTFWEGKRIHGHGTGSCFLYDESYQQVHQIQTVNIGVNADFHECKLTDNGTALISAYKIVPWDLRAVGGVANDTILNSYFQEIDIATGELVFSWIASDHFTMEDSYERYMKNSDAYDFFHLNSVSKTPSGDFLISSRHLHMVALIAGKDSPGPGSPVWILNGKRNQFTDQSGGAALNFSRQHQAQFHNKEGTELTLFDNHAPPSVYTYTDCAVDCSKAMRLSLDTNAKTVRLLATYPHSRGLVSSSMGSIQELSDYGVPDGNIVVGWGANPTVTEYSLEDGSCVMDIQFSPYHTFNHTFGTSHDTSPLITYRAFKADWVGFPSTNPDIAADWETQKIWVSWNGATEVRSWAVVSSNPCSGSQFHRTSSSQCSDLV